MLKKSAKVYYSDHPELKKGLSSGIAHKYYGPFEKVGKNPNNIDYYIKKCGSKKSRLKQVHISRLKTFYHNLTEINKPKTEFSLVKPTKQNKASEHSGSDSDESILDKNTKRNVKTRKILTDKIYIDSESNTSVNETLSVIKQKIKNKTS
ncbi:unnamed protein product [Brachionus calyciflorus]|uniref:Uncharacterized protein n=1 Tax=Brachionus calyciflorus TaxID=104777 RepID=A0A814Q9V8_9BILA|nr:unnamed protein product [Brachionus calyciflorus]